MANRETDNEKYPTVQLDYWSAFGERLVDLLELKVGSTVLDVGTGWGACLIPAAKKIGNNGRIIGIDHWEEAIPNTMKKIESVGLSNASARFMAVQEMTFENSTFDSILCGFIGFTDVYDFSNKEYKQDNKKMSEMLRVLKHGGSAAFSTWAVQEDIEVLRRLVIDYLKKNNKFTKDNDIPPGYSSETAEGFEIITKDAGFKNVKILTENYSLIYQDEDEWWETMSRVGAWMLKKSIGSEGVEDFKETMLLEGLQNYKTENGYSFTKSVIFCYGEK